MATSVGLLFYCLTVCSHQGGQLARPATRCRPCRAHDGGVPKPHHHGCRDMRSSPSSSRRRPKTDIRRLLLSVVGYIWVVSMYAAVKRRVFHLNEETRVS